MWALARNHTEAEVVKGDKVKGNLLLATSLDGTMKTVAAMTAVRVVCANTIRAALEDNRKNGRARAEVSHRSMFDPDSVKESIGVARTSFDRFIESARALAEKPVSADTARDLLRDLIGRPARIVADTPAAVGGSDFDRLIKGSPMPAVKAPKEHRNVSRILDLYAGAGMGAEHIGSRGTAWGLLNAVTQFVDHEAARTADTRLTSAWFGRGADLKDETFARLLAL
jgi:phage/plasmid-like protein (TIGR03299 family)